MDITCDLLLVTGPMEHHTDSTAEFCKPHIDIPKTGAHARQAFPMVVAGNTVVNIFTVHARV